MSQIEVTPEVFTADAIGRPGDRVFYLQARGSFGALTFFIEKPQVAALAERLRELLILVDQADPVGRAEPARDPDLALENPDPGWRIGTIGLAIDEDTDEIVILIQPVEGDETTEEDTGIRFRLQRAQVRSFILHALAVVGEGRPLCQLCGLPMDPDGHRCPASNGHHVP